MRLSTGAALVSSRTFARNDSAGMPVAAMSRHSRAIVRVPTALLAVSVFIPLAVATANATTITLPPPLYRASFLTTENPTTGATGEVVTTPGTQGASFTCFGDCVQAQGGLGSGAFDATETMSNQGPYVSVSSTSALYQGQLGGVEPTVLAELFYSFEVQSTGLGAVEIDFAATGGISDGTGFITGPGGTQAEAAIDVYDNGGTIYYSDQLSYNFGGTGQIDGVIDQGQSGSLNSSSSFLVPTNTIILMEILALADAGQSNPGTVTAYMDPIVSLDPRDGSGYTLVLSQGVTQGLGESPTTTSGVPEPATYAMLGVGLLAMGGLLYRRRQVSCHASRQESGALPDSRR
jgi:hypothetical protein